MDKIEKIELLVHKYFTDNYSIFKHVDANGDVLKIPFQFESRKAYQSEYLMFYKELNDINEVVIFGCGGIFKLNRDGVDYFIRHPHQEFFTDKEGNQRGILVSTLKEMESKVIKRIDSIVNATSFDELIEIIQSEKVRGFGELSIYDTAVRIGSFLNLIPDKVYLHAGAREGLLKLEEKELVPEGSSSEKYILVDDLPEPLKKLHPVEVENLLCSYKKEFGEIG
ncbi:hypothetical protein [Photobacterium leiognathi]|uniref:hypothetical protein n=1 Tax=Photobacterium leiognathi TaxID=553611 RepID=UPI003DA1A3EA